MIMIIISLIILIMQFMILLKTETPLPGLYFLPFYGGYFYYKSLIGGKKLLIFIRTFLQHAYILGLMVLLAISLRVFGNLKDVSDSGDYNAINNANDVFEGFLIGYTKVFGIIILFAILSFIIHIIIAGDMAENFGYSRNMKWLFVFIPITETIMCLISAFNDNYDVERCQTIDREVRDKVRKEMEEEKQNNDENDGSDAVISAMYDSIYEKPIIYDEEYYKNH